MTLAEAFSIPDLLTARSLLCVQPHYDDNDLAAGGTIARLGAAGTRITYVTVTDDLVGVRDDALDDAAALAALARDQEQAGAIVGVHQHHRLGYPDAGAYDPFALRRDLIRIMRQVRPDFVLTCDPWLPYEYHNDHVLTGRVVAEAACLQAGVRRLPTEPAIDAAYQPYQVTGIAFYWTTAPNTFVAIDCYRTQLGDEELALFHAAVTMKEQQWAAQSASSHAEAFKVLRPLHLHCNVDAVQM
jgi:LmbE family N-acetylglucosaminyl deacetylase